MKNWCIIVKNNSTNHSFWALNVLSTKPDIFNGTVLLISFCSYSLLTISVIFAGSPGPTSLTGVQ